MTKKNVCVFLGTDTAAVTELDKHVVKVKRVVRYMCVAFFFFFFLNTYSRTIQKNENTVIF